MKHARLPLRSALLSSLTLAIASLQKTNNVHVLADQVKLGGTKKAHVLQLEENTFAFPCNSYTKRYKGNVTQKTIVKSKLV